MTKLHHPNIVQVLGYIEEPFSIIMEYMPGGDLLQNLHSLRGSEKANILQDCLRALCYLHNRKPQSLIHRDIKLSNILLTQTKRAKIADFGLSRLLRTVVHNDSRDELSRACDENDELTRSVPTERVRAPEMIGNQYTNKIDVYALGIVAYEMFESKRYDPAQGFVWNETRPCVQRVIVEDMLCPSLLVRKSAVVRVSSWLGLGLGLGLGHSTVAPGRGRDAKRL
jgi:serine/threonine protein kinase